jgi:hypothetical protein
LIAGRRVRVRRNTKKRTRATREPVDGGGDVDSTNDDEEESTDDDAASLIGIKKGKLLELLDSDSE